MAAPSNGTMGDYWMRHWCYRCVHDHGFSHVDERLQDSGESCEILLRMIIGEETPEVVQEDYEGGWPPESLVCRMFERCPCKDDPGWEPPIAPTPDPNQGLLFEVIDESPGLPMTVIPIEMPVEIHA
jgi:hypothetical protein